MKIPVNPATTAERRLAMQLAFTRALAEAGSIAEAARAVLSAIAETEGWSAAAFWRLESRAQELCCIEFWSAQGRAVPEFERICRRTWFPLGEKLPGWVYTHAEPHWIPDLRKDKEYVRAYWALKEGLCSSCAFPVIADDEVIGVIELLATEPREPEPILSQMLISAGHQLGELIKRKETQEALKATETRLRSVVAHAPIVLFALDREGRFILGEGRGLENLGLDPEANIGKSIFEVYRDVPEVLEHARRALTGESFSTRVTLPREQLSYETRYTPVFDDAGELTQVIGVAIDVTERQKAEQALLQSKARLVEAERLASLGALAAGVAHEINNPLSYILLNIDLVLRELTSEQPSRHYLEEARAGVERVRVIVQDLKAFSRAHAERRELVDLRRVLDESIELASNEIRYRAHLIRDYREIPLVLANSARLGQVFLNLLVNAAQSMAEGDASRNEIRVSTDVNAQGQVVVSIADTGAGIPPEVKGRIFEPFFTTKPVGEGTGLGLSICHGIITSLGGEISVESRIGEGTTFIVVIPEGPPPSSSPLDREARDTPLDRVSPPPKAPPRLRILVVDDEPVLASALGRLLKTEHDVVVLTSGREASRLLASDQHFDVILCDLIMPDMTGMDLYDELEAKQPELAERMIFMTGGSFTARAREFLGRVENATIDKPFDLATLEARIAAQCKTSARGA